MEKATMTGSGRGVNRRNKIISCSSRYIKTVFKIQQRIRKMPIGQRRAREQRRTSGETVKGRNDKEV